MYTYAILHEEGIHPMNSKVCELNVYVGFFKFLISFSFFLLLIFLVVILFLAKMAMMKGTVKIWEVL